MNQLDLPPDEPTTIEELRARTRPVRAWRREMRRPRKVTIPQPPPPPPPPPPPAQTIAPVAPEEIPNFLAFRHNGSAVIREPNEPIISIRAILIETANYFGIGVSNILGERRTREIVNARHVAAYLSKKLTPYSYTHIGRKLGDLDHTSVLHALRRIQAMIDSQDQTIAEAILTIERKVLR